MQKQKIILIVSAIIILIVLAFAGLYYVSSRELASENAKLTPCNQTYQRQINPMYFNSTAFSEMVLCYARVAAETNNLLICNRVEEGSYRRDCYVEFAVEKNDLSVCKKLKGENASSCDRMAKISPGYLDKNNIYINPNKFGDVKILTPKAGEVLDKNKEYKITWTTDTFSDKDVISQLIISEYFGGGVDGPYITFEPIPAKQGYYYFTPNSLHEYDNDAGGDFIKPGKKYFIHLSAAKDPNDDRPEIIGTSDLFEFN